MADNSAVPAVGEFEGETPSPLCNHFLEQASAFVAGSVPEEDFRAGVAEALESVAQARSQTLGNLENDGVAEEVVEAFERSFEDMQIALEDLSEFASSPDEESHQSVRSALHQAAASTVFAMNVLQNAQFQDGPSDMPLFNALFKMKENFMQGGVEADQLKDALAGVVSLTKQAIEELLQAEGEQPPQRDGLVRAYKEQIQSLETAGKTVDSGDKQQIEEVFQKLLLTSEGVKEAIGSLNQALMAKGPCRLERSNVLLSAADMYASGGIGPDGFAESLEAFESALREEMDKFAELSSMPNDSESIQAQVENAKEAYELHEDAIALFSELLEGEADADSFTKAKELLIEASEKLADAREALIAIGENEGKVTCVRCGAKNEPGRVCSSCGAQLPQQAGGTASTVSYQESDGAVDFGDELEITENLERLFTAVNDLAEEKCSDEEFEEVLVWMDNLLAEAQSTMPEVPEMKPPMELNEEQQKQVEAVTEDLVSQRAFMMTGLAEFRGALGTLQNFFETRESETLVQGVREVKAGAIKMQQAEKALNLVHEALARATKEAEEMEGQETPPE